MKFNIYVGVPSYDSRYIGTYEFANQEEADDFAHQMSCEEYEMYAGLHGIPSWEECYQELTDTYAAEIEAGEYDENDIEAMAEDLYNEEIESWAEYRAVLESEDKEFYKIYSESDKCYL